MQQPAKLQWKHSTPYGLSASQFGMALGYCGCVSDYVDYLRNIVGTSQEFHGNACTDHGIRTEPKARALYELLTGQKVHDGGFFLTEDKLLGCSPDGQVFYWELEPSPLLKEDPAPLHPGGEADGPRHPGHPRSGSPATEPGASPPPLHDAAPPSKRPRCSAHSFPSSSSCSSSSWAAPVLRRRRRVLEIKSPYRALFHGGRADCAPFGIPHRYLCQLQGQLAIAQAEEADFVVYATGPPPAVQAWRVRPSPAFWGWAAPKLRQVAAWVREGPPPGLNRAFRFDPFDFARLEVRPLVRPFDLAAQQALEDAVRFGFFTRARPPQGGKGAGEPAASQEEADRIESMLSHPVTKFFFGGLAQDAGGEVDGGDGSGTPSAWDKPEEGAQTFRLTLDDKKRLEDAIATVSFGSLVATPLERLIQPFITPNPAIPVRGSAPTVRLFLPDDWEKGEVKMEISGSANGTQIMALRFSDRSFFELLHLPASSVRSDENTGAHTAVMFEEVGESTVERNDSQYLYNTKRDASYTHSCFCEGSPLVESFDDRAYYYISSDESGSD